MKIVENVYQLDSAKGSHVFLIKGEENILIDTGMPGLAERILAELKTLDASTIRYILLTHHDIDHIGNAARIQETTGALLFAPEKDIPYILGEKKRPGIKRAIETIANVKKPRIDASFDTRQSFGEVHAIFAPGHTPGHTIFQYRNVVFTGDLFRAMGGKMSVMGNLMNLDVAEVKKSITLLKNLKFDWLLPSHGEPTKNGEAVKAFIKGF